MTEEDPTEARLRAALASRAAHVDAVTQDPGPDLVVAGRTAGRTRPRWLAPMAVAASIVVVGALVAVALRRGDERGVDVGAGSSTTEVTEEATTTTEPEPATTTPSVVPTNPTIAATTTTRRPTTTTTTVPPDGSIAGWPAKGSTRYPTAKAAATAFVTNVLGFAKPTLKRQSSESVPVGGTATVTFTPRSTAGATTTVLAIRNGGSSWLIRGATSGQGTIDRSTFGAGRIDVAGKASAFEATVAVRALKLDGTTLGSDIAMGGSAEQLPYEGGVSYTGGPAAFVLVGEGDASGQGDLVWACVVLDPALA
jgi:hypothetical protein